jgi:peptide-methionine (S)-S-oxide reductase
MPELDDQNTQTACLAGGCFWGLEELIGALPGVLETEVGYAGGSMQDARYDKVKTGATGHAEALKLVFNPRQIGYRHLLFEFFRIHNPTMLNRQSNDIGTQYRSAIFYIGDEQRRIAEDVIKSVQASGDWGAKVVTEVTPLKDFYRAEEYHQKYLAKNPHGYRCHYARNLDLGEHGETR